MSSLRVVLASDNAGKLVEFSSVLAQADISMIPQGQLGISSVEEPHVTFVENALLKARHASHHSGLPALADDSGLCVSALDDAPGVFSARYAEMAGGIKSDKANNQHLLDQMAGVTNRRARYIAVLVFVRSATDPVPIIVEGVWHGEIVSTPKGMHGFGYDPYFYIPELGKTAAELTPEQKNNHSHRGKALEALLKTLHSREG